MQARNLLRKILKLEEKGDYYEGLDEGIKIGKKEEQDKIKKLEKKYQDFKEFMADQVDKREKNLIAQCKAGEMSNQKIKRLECQVASLVAGLDFIRKLDFTPKNAMTTCLAMRLKAHDIRFSIQTKEIMEIRKIKRLENALKEISKSDHNDQCPFSTFDNDCCCPVDIAQESLKGEK